MQPLADLLRPTSLDNYIGQAHLVGPGAPLRLAIESGHVHSMIFWGPPGCGKTTLAKIIASSTGADFHYLSAVSAKKEDIKKIVDLQLANVSTRLKHKDITVTFSARVKDYLARKGYDDRYGARPLKRVIQNELLDELATAIIEKKFEDGDIVRVSAKKEKIVLEK